MQYLEDLSARTQAEINHDKMVLRELAQGENIQQALKTAAATYGDESWLVRTGEDLNCIRAHYLSLDCSGESGEILGNGDA